jgi:hypothetical protein
MKAFSDERQIRADKHFIERGKFNIGAYSFWNFIKIGDPSAPVSISTAPNFDLIPYSKIAGLRDTLLDEDIDVRYVTVLRIFWGFRDNQIKLIFLPDKARELAANSNTYTFDVPYIANKRHACQFFENETIVYHWNGAEMESVSFVNDENPDDCPKEWICNYQRSIIIDKDGEGTIPFEPFQFDGKSDDDARGATFTFQALNNFYKDDDDLYVTNVVLARDGIPGRRIYGHSVAFSNTEPISPLG